MLLPAPGDHPRRLRGLPELPTILLRLAIVLGLLASVLPPPSALSQVTPGASLTVLRGMVAVSRADGTAIFPAGTGLTLAIGDIVGTLERTRAIVTFFSGSEIELGSNTTIVIRRLDRDLLDEANVTVEHVSGASLIRVPPESPISSAIRVVSRDTVALVRSGEIGHGVDPRSNNVTVACVDGAWRCPSSGSDGGVAFPNEQTLLIGQMARTVTGKGDTIEQRVPAGASVWDVLADGAALGVDQGTDGPQPNVVPREPRDRSKEEDGGPPPQRPPDATPTPTRTPTPTPTATPTATPTPPAGIPGPPCGTPQDAFGSTGTFTIVHSVGRNSGVIHIEWDAFGAPDQFAIFYQGVLLFNSGFVTNQGSADVPFGPGVSTFVVVVVTTSAASTQWTYEIACLP